MQVGDIGKSQHVAEPVVNNAQSLGNTTSGRIYQEGYIPQGGAVILRLLGVSATGYNIPRICRPFYISNTLVSKIDSLRKE